MNVEKVENFSNKNKDLGIIVLHKEEIKVKVCNEQILRSKSKVQEVLVVLSLS